MHLTRRDLLSAALASPLAWPTNATTTDTTAQAAPGRASARPADPAMLMRSGGLVLVLRHALAPGTFDPPGFQLGDCSTQRQLDNTGRAQATQIGQWLAQRGLRPSRVALDAHTVHPYAICERPAFLLRPAALEAPDSDGVHSG